jgi:hypothetical protein
MRVRNIAFVVALAVCGVWAQTTYSLREVRVSPKGDLLSVLLVLHGFEVVISGNGEVVDVETLIYPDSPMEYRFDDTRIDRVQKGTVTCLLDAGKLKQVGDFPIKYLAADENRVASIGDTLVSYQFVDGKMGSIERIGRLEFRYFQKRLNSVGSIRFEYRKQDGNVERFTRNMVKDKEQAFGIRICAAAPQTTR